MAKKKQLRIQVQSSGRKAKPKPPTVVLWDGVNHPLPLVQKRLKTVKSLRDLTTKKELSLSALQSLPDKAMVLGSTDESDQAVPAVDADKELLIADTTSLASSKPDVSEMNLSAELDNGLKLSKHARERMYEREITPNQVTSCYDAAMTSAPINDKVTAEETQVDQMKGGRLAASVGTTKIILDCDKKLVVTAISTENDTLAIEPDRADMLRKCGLLQELRNHLRIRVQYNMDLCAFEFWGNKRAIELAKRRLLSKEVGSVVKVPSDSDCSGKIIGRGGSNIKKIQLACGIRNISVSYDEDRKQMIMFTSSALNENAKGLMYRIVDDMIHNRPWQDRPL